MADQAQTLTDLVGLLAHGSVSAVELAEASLDAMAATGDALNAVITATPELALAEARAADAARAKGAAGPLTGMPLAHKDIFCTRGVRTSCGSRMLDSFIAPYDATVVERLRAAGMACVAKANMDEFAMGSSNEHSWYGPVGNPWAVDRAPGGSSGGSAALVAAGVVPVATGTDTGGSIRQPAAFTGVTGLKPTYGRVSRWGMVAFASSLDQGGCFARSAEDIALVLGAMAGFDAKDSTSAQQPVPDYSAALDLPDGLRLGIPREYLDGLDDASANALTAVRKQLEARGVQVSEVSLPHTGVTVPTYYVVAGAEASANLSRYDGVRFGHRCEDPADLNDLYRRSRDEAFGAEVKRRILTGTYVLSVGYYDAYYVKAQQVRRLIRDEFLACFQDVDALLAPTTPGPAFALGSIGTDDPTAMYRQDIYTVGASLAGLPALSLPAGCTEVDGTTLPLGAQLIGPHFSEDRLLALAHAVQQATDWHLALPPVHAGALA